MGIESSQGEYSGYGADFTAAFETDEVVLDYDPLIGVSLVQDGGQKGEVWTGSDRPDALYSSGIHAGYDQYLASS